MSRRIALAAATTLAACSPAPDAPAPPPTTTTAPTEPTTAPTTAPPPQVAAPPPSPRSAAAPAGVGATSVAPADPHPPSTTAAPPDPSPPSQTARVSWYGAESGGRTADGTAFDGSQMVFAHRSMAFGTMVRFCGPLGCVVARCADRGPFIAGRLFDLSRAAFAAVAPLGSGVATVTWEAA